MNSPKLNYVVVQPTPFCNLACQYCYLPERNRTVKMSTDTVRLLFDFLFREPEYIDSEVSVNWHAGEPLTLPIGFYESSVCIQESLTPPTTKIRHRIQTNAVLINQEWCDFLKARKFVVSVSLDGPKRFHDSRRVDRLGRGTFDRVMRGIKLLQENSIPFDLVGVMSAESLHFAEEFFEFYSALCPRQIGINFEEVVGTNLKSSFHQCEAEFEVRAFLEKFLTLRDDKAPHIRLRDLDEMDASMRRWRGSVR